MNIKKIEAVQIPEEAIENGSLVIKNKYFARILTEDRIEMVLPVISMRKLPDDTEQVKIPEPKKEDIETKKKKTVEEELEEEDEDDFDEEFEDDEEEDKEEELEEDEEEDKEEELEEDEEEEPVKKTTKNKTKNKFMR